MRNKLILFTVFTLLFITFFKRIELLSLNLGLSWTFSKILPYFILVICGILLFIQFIKINFNNLLKLIIGFIILILPFLIGFVLNPIYEGDFSKQGTSIKSNLSPKDFMNDGLMVVTIPDCPFCFGAIEKLKIIKRRNPNLIIDFVVCSTKKQLLKKYIKEIDGKFSIRLADNPEGLAKSSNFKFPTFFKVVNSKPIYQWSNDQFGVCAIDDFESSKDLFN
jgi:hypothetical protein